MTDIEKYLNQLLSSRYGKDVRQAIHDAIWQCYHDGKAGAVDLEAREMLENKADKKDIFTPFNFKGSITYAALPVDGNSVNDTYYVTDKKCKYTWDGTEWYQSSMNEGDYQEELSQLFTQLVQLSDTLEQVPQYRTVDNVAEEYGNLIANYDKNGCFVCSSEKWNDLPNNSSCIVTNQKYSPNYRIQIAINVQSGVTYTRIINSNNVVFRDWVEYPLLSELTKVSDKVNTLPQYRSVKSDNYGRLTANIADEGFYMISSSDWDDFPLHNAGILLVFKYSPNYNLQIAVSLRYAAMVTRVVGRSTGKIFRDWAEVGNLQAIKILCVGDSIAYGARNSKKGFVGDLGMPYENKAKAGATLSTKVTDVTNIPTQLENVTDYEPDAVVSNGGTNDYFKHAPLGDIPTKPVTNETEVNALNLETVMGGLQKLFWVMINKYPNAQRFFLITHRTKARLAGINEKVEWPTTANNAGYTFDELHDAIVKVCEIYNVKVIDVYKESMINTAFDCYVSATDYNDDNTITDTEYVDSDGIHPLAYGYKHGYLPLVKQALQLGSAK